MKHSRFAVALLLASSAVAVAQSPPPGPPPRGGPPIEALAKELGLDDTQKAEVKRIFDEHRARMDTDLRQQLATVLTAEQLAKFDAIRKEHRPPEAPRGEKN